METAEMSRLRVVDSVLDLIGETPLLKFKKLVPANAAEIYAKLEYVNPGFSIKDRAALGMILRAEQQGLLKKGGTILEATAGNTGVGLALVGVNRGYRVIVCIPERFSEEKVKVMKALGADVVRTPDSEGMQGAIRKVRELAKDIPDAFMALQFENMANPDFHYETTGREIWEQLQGKVDAVVVGVGTGGTLTGVARYLKERNPACLSIAVESQGSILQGGEPGEHKVEGIGVSFIPGTYDASLVDQVIMVYDKDAFPMVLELARKEGVLGGSSSGANVFAAIEVAKRLGPGKRVVTIIPDSAERYLSKDIFKGTP